MRGLVILFLVLPLWVFGQTMKKSIKAHEGGVTEMVYVAETNQIISAGMDNRFHIWDLAQGAKIKSLAGHSKSLFVEVMGGFVYTSGDGKMIKWSLETLKPSKILNHGSDVSGVAANPGNNSITSTGASDIIIWDETGKKVITLPAQAPTAPKYSSDFSTMYFHNEKQIFALKPVMQKIETLISTQENITAYDVYNDLVVVGQESNSLAFYQGGTLEISLPLPSRCTEVVVSGDGQYVFVGTNVGTVLVVDIKSKNILNEIPVHSDEVSSIIVRNDQLITGSKDSFIKVYDISYLNILAVNNPRAAATGPPPEIEIIQPKLLQEGDTIKLTEPEYVVKGKVSSQSGVFLLLVAGSEVSVGPDGNFSHKVKLHYWDNIITVKAIDNNKTAAEMSFDLHRPFRGEESEYTRRGSDFALIIATNEYDEISDLTNPVFDAQTIEKELTDNYNFNVQTLYNPTQNELYTALRSYNKKTFSEHDQLFIFIAGHGEYDDVFQEGYLVVKDSKKNDEVKTSYISHSNLRTIVNNIQCDHILLMMDVCFGGTFDPIIARRGEEGYQAVNRDEFIYRKLQYKTRLYITSGGKEYVPDGRPGSHSPFARRFIEALRGYGGADKVLTLNEIGSFIEKVTPEPRRGEFGDNEPGSDFLFVSNP